MGYGLRTLACVAALAGLLVGCEDQQEAAITGPMSIAGAPEPSQPQGNISASDAQQHNIAYTYSYTFELPHSQTRPLYEQHRTLCEEAGPSQCQIESAYANDNLGAIKAKMTLRAAPNWLANFRTRLAKDAAAAGGQITTLSIEGEDLSQNIIDTEARLRTQTTLRDRLLHLLANRTGKLNELLEIERELARVQEELDKTQSGLAHLRARISMSKIIFEYRITERELEKLSVKEERSPVNLWQTAKDSLLSLAQFLMFVLPWLIPLGLLIWGLLRWRDRKQEEDA